MTSYSFKKIIFDKQISCQRPSSSRQIITCSLKSSEKIQVASGSLNLAVNVGTFGEFISAKVVIWLHGSVFRAQAWASANGKVVPTPEKGFVPPPPVEKLQLMPMPPPPTIFYRCVFIVSLFEISQWAGRCTLGKKKKILN